MCIFYRKLNNVTIGDTYPLPNIQEILDKLGNARYYSALDCASGYCQIALREQDKPKTAFSAMGNHYEFNRMSFGLKSAPATYQRMMNTVLCNVLGERSFVYLHDVIVFGRTSKEHNEQYEKISLAIRDKCEFLKPELKYLGHVITPEGIQPDSDKVKTIQNLKTPQNTSKLNTFLACTGYYRDFIPEYGKFAVIQNFFVKT